MEVLIGALLGLGLALIALGILPLIQVLTDRVNR